MDRAEAEQAVQRFYEAEAAFMASETRDFSRVAATLTKDILLCEPASLPYGGEYRGHAAFEQWLQAFADTWSSMEMHGAQTFVDGCHVTSWSHVYAVLRQTGETVDWPLLQLFRLSDGRIAELRPFHWDTAAMMPAISKLNP